jgi:adenylosuccinate lyase
VSYDIVQRNALKVWEKGADFLMELKHDPQVMDYMKEDELVKLFDIGYHTKNVDIIFKRVFVS